MYLKDIQLRCTLVSRDHLRAEGPLGSESLWVRDHCCRKLMTDGLQNWSPWLVADRQAALWATALCWPMRDKLITSLQGASRTAAQHWTLTRRDQVTYVESRNQDSEWVESPRLNWGPRHYADRWVTNWSSHRRIWLTLSGCYQVCVRNTYMSWKSWNWIESVKEMAI